MRATFQSTPREHGVPSVPQFDHTRTFRGQSSGSKDLPKPSSTCHPATKGKISLHYIIEVRGQHLLLLSLLLVIYLHCCLIKEQLPSLAVSAETVTLGQEETLLDGVCLLAMKEKVISVNPPALSPLKGGIS